MGKRKTKKTSGGKSERKTWYEREMKESFTDGSDLSCDSVADEPLLEPEPENSVASRKSSSQRSLRSRRKKILSSKKGGSRNKQLSYSESNELSDSSHYEPPSVNQRTIQDMSVDDSSESEPETEEQHSFTSETATHNHEMFCYGLEKDVTVRVYAKEGGPFDIQGTKPSQFADLPFREKHIKFENKFITVEREYVYDHSPEKCFSVFRHYLNFLAFATKKNQDEARESGLTNFESCPQWEKTLPSEVSRNGPGSRVRYSKYEDGVVKSIVEEIKLCSDFDVDQQGNKVYRFASKYLEHESQPWLSSRGHEFLMIFSTFDQRPEQCHLRYIHRQRSSSLFGFNLQKLQRGRLEVLMGHHLKLLGKIFETKFSPKAPKKDSKVLIVGAGPSGLHMAHLLVQKGLPAENITILEKEDRHGGKSLSIRSKTLKTIPNPKLSKDGSIIYGDKSKEDMLENGAELFHEMGTGYLSSTYWSVRKFLKDLQNKSPPNLPDITREVGPESYAFEGDNIPEDEVLNLYEWMFHNAALKTNYPRLLSVFPFLGPFISRIEVYASWKKYCRLHKDLFGSYYGSMPSRRTRKQLKYLLLPFEEFLKQHQLESIRPVMIYSLTGQGCGVLDQLPTFWAMTWLTPHMVDSYLQWQPLFRASKKGIWPFRSLMDHLDKKMRTTGRSIYDFDQYTKGMLISSWTSVWDRVLDVNQLRDRIKYNVNISSVKRRDVYGKVKVYSKYNWRGSEYSETFDFLIMAAPVGDAYVDSTKKIFPIDLTNKEKDLLLSPNITGSKFRSYLCKPEQTGNYSREHMRVFADAIARQTARVPEIEAGQGEVFCVRDSYKALQPFLSSESGHETDPAKDVLREKILLQYCSPGTNLSDKLLNKKFEAFFTQRKQDYGSLDGLEVLKSKSWTYFTRFEGEDLVCGKVWDLLDAQGENGTYFVHASSHYEAILPIVNYNNMILEGVRGHLEGFEKPKSDETPEEYQRVENFMLNLSNYFPTRIILMFVTGILNAFWLLYYTISWPLQEGYLLKKKRHHSLELFKTPGLGDPMSFTIETLLHNAPVIKGYLNYVIGKFNGMPRDFLPDDYDFDAMDMPPDVDLGDSGFKTLMSKKNGMLHEYPSIPRYPDAQYSLQFAISDYRQATRKFIELLNWDLENYMGGKIQRFLGFVEENFPNQYSWWMSWILATQLRFYVGFSYRFNDVQGGGLRIPKCPTLEAAVKKIGIDAGERFCLTACKTNSEETLGQANLKVEFIPDHLIGKAGFGCTVRMREGKKHAYCSHKLFKSRKIKDKDLFEEFAKFNW
eukprot:snap_masked-scaffold_2-processed-gene-13.16-mRNA-1 protein AED:1.00 eAED:1.00 QI:0/-1/0/0/-1/1/1/0/1293